MRFLTLVYAAALFGGAILPAVDASAQRINGEWELEDDSDPNDNFAELGIDGTEFYVVGEVAGVGTAGDIVAISYLASAPTSVNADEKQGRVRQSGFSTVTFFIDSGTPARDLNVMVTPEKCSIDGKVQAVSERGQVTVSCSGTNIYSGISADQEASITAAFLDDDRVKFKVNNDGSKGSLSIKLKGTALQDQ
jgi:hypothetical protein